MGVEETWGQANFPPNLFWLSTKLLMPLPPVCSAFFLQRTSSHPLMQHGLNSNLIYLTVISSFYFSSSLPSPGALHYPLCGPWQDPGPPPADPVPLGCLFFFCSQNRLNDSGGKKKKNKCLDWNFDCLVVKNTWLLTTHQLSWRASPTRFRVVHVHLLNTVQLRKIATE